MLLSRVLICGDVTISAILFLRPFGLVLLPTKSLVIVALYLEELLEVNFAVDFALQGGISPSAAREQSKHGQSSGRKCKMAKSQTRMHTHTHRCRHIRMQTHGCTHTRMHRHGCTHTHTYAHRYWCTTDAHRYWCTTDAHRYGCTDTVMHTRHGCTHIQMHTHTQMHTHGCTHTHTDAHTQTRRHTHTHHYSMIRGSHSLEFFTQAL